MTRNTFRVTDQFCVGQVLLSSATDSQHACYHYKGSHCTDGRYQALNQDATCVQSALVDLKWCKLCIGILGRNFPFVFYLYVSKVVNLWTLSIS